MSIVSDVLITNLPAKRKTTPSGWISFNAVCCHHTGNTQDKRNRGGVLERDDVISYHCFNCGFKASWQPGRPLSHKMRKLLGWMNVSDDQVNKLALQVMQINEGIEVKDKILQLPTFVNTPLPADSILLNSYTGDSNEYLNKVLMYMHQRGLYLEDSDFYWSPHIAYRERLIIPFKYNGDIVGWTARHIGNGKPKYLADSQPGYVFNIDNQREQKIFVIVTEGPMDAIPLDGVAILGSEVNPQQAMLINKLNKEVIVVPDRDKTGKKLVNAAIENGWGVSMPDWDPTIKDSSDAIKKYGRLYTLHSIINSVLTSSLKIRLKEKHWFNSGNGGKW